MVLFSKTKLRIVLCIGFQKGKRSTTHETDPVYAVSLVRLKMVFFT